MVKVRPNTQIRRIIVQMQKCRGPRCDQRNGRVVALGYPELLVRSDIQPTTRAFGDAVVRELRERFGVRPHAQPPPTYDSVSAGMVENAIKLVEEKVRNRELHGIVTDAKLVHEPQVR